MRPASAPARLQPRVNLQSWLATGFVRDGLCGAFDEACVRLDVERIGDPLSVFPHKTLGGLVAARDGERSWLKVSGITGGVQATMRERERSAPEIEGLARPAILDCLDWSTPDGVNWRALRMSYVASPAVNHSGQFQPVTDALLARLRHELAILARHHAPHFAYSPEDVRYAITSRFGADAPAAASDWHLAHGDLTWINLTSPDLMLLDWERWGEAPQGYDIGYLICHSAERPDLIARLEAVFADELSRPSGKVGLLFACAEMLNRLDIHFEGVAHRRAVEDVARRALAR